MLLMVDRLAYEISTYNMHSTAKLCTLIFGHILVVYIVYAIYYDMYNRKLPTKPHPNDGGMSFINHNSDVYEESNFDPNKSLIMYPDGVNNSKDYVVQNPLVSSK